MLDFHFKGKQKKSLVYRPRPRQFSAPSVKFKFFIKFFVKWLLVWYEYGSDERC
jgi:hypothetical protein